MIKITDKYKYYQRVSIPFLVSVSALRVILDVLYVTYVHPVWSSKGFSFDFTYVRYFESWILLFAVSLLTPHVLKHPSDIFVLILSLFLLLPMTSLYGFAGEPSWIIYSVLFGFIVILLVQRGQLLDFPILASGSRSALIISLVMVIIAIGWILISGGISYMNINMKEVYEYRSDVNVAINQGVFAYLNSWAFKVFNLYLFAYALDKRHWLLAVFFFIIQVFFFGVMAQKSILVFPFVVLVMWYYLRKNRSLLMIPIGLSCIIIVTAFIWQLSADIYSFPISLVVRRLFYVPANSVYDYYHFFVANPHLYWSNSITKAWIEYPYSLNYPHLIGEYQAISESLGKSTGTGTYVNSSFIATGYMQAGFAGLIFYCLVVGFLFRLVDSLASLGVSPWIAISITIVPMGSLLISADLLTALLTHGIAISLILLFLSRKLFFHDD